MRPLEQALAKKLEPKEAAWRIVRHAQAGKLYAGQTEAERQMALLVGQVVSNHHADFIVDLDTVLFQGPESALYYWVPYRCGTFIRILQDGKEVHPVEFARHELEEAQTLRAILEPNPIQEYVLEVERQRVKHLLPLEQYQRALWRREE